jgi:hypothetical protein
VVTHNKPTTSHPPVYTFVTDGVGATVMQQALPLGLVDEIRVHVIRSCWVAARPV